MEKKIFVTELKEVNGEGVGMAVIATLNVIDRDRDVTLPGAFGNQTVKLVGAHQSFNPTIGVAKIFETGNDVVAEFKFNLDMPMAREWFQSVKFNFDNKVGQEWSYAFDVLDAGDGLLDNQQVRFLKKLKVHEASPVLVGAGVDTRTLAVKADKAAVGMHKTESNDGAWDAGANRRNVLEDQDSSYYRKIYGWRDPDGEVGTKSSWKFIHHFVNADGEPGDFSTRAGSAAIAALNGGRGVDVAAQPWVKDREGIHKHIAKHLKDAGKEPPDFIPLSELREKSLLTVEQEFDLLDDALARSVGFKNRCEAIMTLRIAEGKEGRLLSRANRDRLEKLFVSMKGMVSDVGNLLEGTDPEADGKALQARAAWERARARQSGVIRQ